MGSKHQQTFPGESAIYRQARDELLQAEADLRAQVETVAALRRQLPEGGEVPQDYLFEQVLPATATLRMSELFAPGKDTLLLYSFMYAPDAERPCPACTSIADIYNSYAHYLNERVNFAVVARAPVQKLAALAAERDWKNFRFLSSANNSYNRDYHAEAADDANDQSPIMNVFQRRNAVIHHYWASELLWVPRDGHPRHVDMIWPIWNLLDMTPEGRGDFFPDVFGQ